MNNKTKKCEECVDGVDIDDYTCEHCDGEGVVPCDEYDPDSHCYMPGVGEEACVCQAQ